MGTLLLVSAFYLFVAANAATAQTRPSGGLRETMIALDRMLFDAYNRCDLESFRSYLIDGNLEFYHDKTGLTTCHVPSAKLRASEVRRLFAIPADSSATKADVSRTNSALRASPAAANPIPM